VQVSKVDPIKASIQISEAEYYEFSKELNEAAQYGIKPGEEGRARLILADGSMFPEKGKLSAVDRQIDQKTGTLRVDALFPNPGNLLRPGFFAKMRVPVRLDVGALLIPQRAVNELQGSYQVATVVDGKAVIKPVELGEKLGSMWLVKSGLKAGDTVIVEGIQKVRQGMSVDTKPWTPPAEATPAPSPAASPSPSPAASPSTSPPAAASPPPRDK
jgi:membrane fusion protein (multidrug efflux system)